MSEPTALTQISCPNCGRKNLSFTRISRHLGFCDVTLDDDGDADVEEFDGEYDFIEEIAECQRCNWQTEDLKEVEKLIKRHDPRFKPDQSKRARNVAQTAASRSPEGQRSLWS